MTTYTSLLPKTGQTTSYVTGDDGDIEKGVARSFTVLDTGQYSGTANVTMAGNTEAMSNNCVQDNVTGLMWIRNKPTSIGCNPYGKGIYGTFPWTTDGDGNGLFPYKDAVNLAGLGGHSDWRVPNKYEIDSITDAETTAFASEFLVSLFDDFWSSTSYNTPGAISCTGGLLNIKQKTVNAISSALLVRGDPQAPAGGGGSLIGGNIS